MKFMKKPEVLFAQGNQICLQSLMDRLLQDDFEINEASSETDISQTVQNQHPDLVIIGSFRSNARVELRIAEQIRRLDRAVPLILITTHSSEEHAIAALKVGVNDYFKTPFSGEEVLASVKRNLFDVEVQPSPNSVTTASRFNHFQRLMGDSQAMRDLRAILPKIAATDSTILITGETGTGKELVAQLIHQRSPRRQHAMISVNCAALPDSLLESELFGYEKGAFTGAHSSQPGMLQLADGGTFFFDEIGDMSPYAQAKILRCVENKEVYRLGGGKSVPLNIRVIAATNQDLERLVAEDRFRKDLYYRVNVVRVHLPPLRKRTEDIPPLLEYFLQEMNRRCGRQVAGFCSDALASFLHYDWPGNVRELKNLLESIFVSSAGGLISVEDLPAALTSQIWEHSDVKRDERALLLSALYATNWNKSEAAKRLHWSRMTVYRKLQKYHIEEG
jgi:DNA-binding NtrC family response regulator